MRPRRDTPLRRARGRSAPFRQARRARGAGNTPFGVPVATSHVDPGPEQEYVYWHPDRLGVELAATAVLREVREATHASVSICKSPVHERWLVWARVPQNQNSLCPGWSLLFVWEHPQTHEFLPLSVPLLVTNLYLCMKQKQGPAKEYFNRVQTEWEAKAKAREAAYTDRRRTEQRELLKTRRISSAGRGNRFALHHDGTVEPSRGEQNWSAETAKWRVPSEVQARLDRDRDRLREAGVVR